MVLYGEIYKIKMRKISMLYTLQR